MDTRVLPVSGFERDGEMEERKEKLSKGQFGSWLERKRLRKGEMVKRWVRSVGTLNLHK